MKDDGKDVRFLDDAILYLQNAIASENHAIESYSTTKDKKWMDIAKEIRRNRSKRMYEIIPKNKDERYCLIKHILACAMALKEMGTRYQEEKNDNLAKECFEEARLYEQLTKLLFKGG